MSYLDDEIIKDLTHTSIIFDILVAADHDSIVDIINENIPFSGNQIAWNLLKDNIHLGISTSKSSLDLLEKKIKNITEHAVIFIGDSTDHAYAIAINDLEPALQIFSKIPQHTYILQKKPTWIAGISFEGDIDFAAFIPFTPLPPSV